MTAQNHYKTGEKTPNCQFDPFLTSHTPPPPSRFLAVSSKTCHTDPEAMSCITALHAIPTLFLFRSHGHSHFHVVQLPALARLNSMSFFMGIGPVTTPCAWHWPCCLQKDALGGRAARHCPPFPEFHTRAKHLPSLIIEGVKPRISSVMVSAAAETIEGRGWSTCREGPRALHCRRRGSLTGTGTSPWISRTWRRGGGGGGGGQGMSSACCAMMLLCSVHGEKACKLHNRAKHSEQQQ